MSRFSWCLLPDGVVIQVWVIPRDTLNLRLLKKLVEMMDAVSTGLHPSAIAFEPDGQHDASGMDFESLQAGGLRELKENCNLRGMAERGCGF